MTSFTFFCLDYYDVIVCVTSHLIGCIGLKRKYRSRIGFYQVRLASHCETQAIFFIRTCVSCQFLRSLGGRFCLFLVVASRITELAVYRGHFTEENASVIKNLAVYLNRLFNGWPYNGGSTVLIQLTNAVKRCSKRSLKMFSK